MQRILVVFSFIFLSHFAASAYDDGFEVGLASGNSNVIASDTLKNAVTKGDNQSYWLAYGLDSEWGLELGYDHFDFDSVTAPLEHEAISLSGTYRFWSEGQFHPLAKLGFGTVSTKAANGDKTNSFGAKMMVGAEVEFKYVSIGGGVNYHYISRLGDLDSLKNAQVYAPVLFITFHGDKADVSSYPSHPSVEE